MVIFNGPTNNRQWVINWDYKFGDGSAQGSIKTKLKGNIFTSNE